MKRSTVVNMSTNSKQGQVRPPPALLRAGIAPRRDVPFVPFSHSRFPRRRVAVTCIMGMILIPLAACANPVANSKHNLSVTGPGTVKATVESDVCIFCHTAHRTTGQTPLWSQSMSSVTNYIIYSSPTVKATVGQPDGSSRLCLSCHDGTVALGMVSSRAAPIAIQSGVTTLPHGPSNLGTDLSGDHPISFVYDQALVNLNNQLKDPATLDSKLKLDALKKVQCATCHNAHDDQFGSFLVMDNTGSALCVGCHLLPGWTGSAHASSAATLPGVRAQSALKAARNKTAQTVAENACENCHTSHKAGSKARLLHQAKEEENCFVCHNGKIVSKDLAAEFKKPSAHPVLQSSSTHSMAEDPVNSPRHAACADCHNPHSTNTRTAPSRTAPASIAGVKGLDSAGIVVNPATREISALLAVSRREPQPWIGARHPAVRGDQQTASIQDLKSIVSPSGKYWQKS